MRRPGRPEGGAPDRTSGADAGFRVVDFSGVHFRDGVPPERRGKFLQIVEGGDAEVLVLSPYGLSKYHAQILERYCAENGIEGRYLRTPEYYLADGAGIEVVGGGHWRIDDRNRQLLLYGESTAYGRFDAEGLPGKIGSLPGYRGYDVSVG